MVSKDKERKIYPEESPSGMARVRILAICKTTKEIREGLYLIFKP